MFPPPRDKSRKASLGVSQLYARVQRVGTVQLLQGTKCSTVCFYFIFVCKRQGIGGAREAVVKVVKEGWEGICYI